LGDDASWATPDEGVGWGKLTVAVERVDGGKLRCTGATWSDAVVIFPGEVLAFQNISHALRAPALGTVVETPPAAAPDPGEDDFEGGRMSGHFTCGACGRSASLPEGAN
jgi:hypothetical protein